MSPYEPHPWLTGGHRMTIGAALMERPFPDLAGARVRTFRVDADTRVRALCDGPPGPGPTLLLMHGLTGDADADYMRGTAREALAAGWRVVRLNLRNCGGTVGLTPTLYHSGLTDDLRAVALALLAEGAAPLVLGGFSMGGNIALKLCAEWGDDAPVAGVVVVSPAIDLPAASAAIREPRNRIYEAKFVLGLRRSYRAKARAWPERYSADDLRGIWRIWDFDDRLTAPGFGFDGADDYYRRASALPRLGQVTVPGLILHAEDDPFVPVASFRRPEVADHPTLALEITSRGGHVGYVGRDRRGARWMEQRIAQFASRLS